MLSKSQSVMTVKVLPKEGEEKTLKLRVSPPNSPGPKFTLIEEKRKQQQKSRTGRNKLESARTRRE